jgi:hypothetical protein
MTEAVHWRIEKRARRIAAMKMGLVKDRQGERLPDDLWRQCIRDAEHEYEQGYDLSDAEEAEYLVSRPAVSPSA